MTGKTRPRLFKEIKPDIDEAFNWCEKAGDQGLYLAQWYMGVFNAKGGPNHPADGDRKAAANFHPDPMEVFHDIMNKGSAQQN